MSRLDWKEGGRFDRNREVNEIDAALRGHQNTQIEDAIGYWRFWPERSEMHAVYDEATGVGLLFHPQVMLPTLHVTHGEGQNQDTSTGFYYVDDIYVTMSFEQFSRTGLTEIDVLHESYLRDRVFYDGKLFRVASIHVTGQISKRDMVVSLEGSQIKPDEYILDPQFAGIVDPGDQPLPPPADP